MPALEGSQFYLFPFNRLHGVQQKGGKKRHLSQVKWWHVRRNFNILPITIIIFIAHSSLTMNKVDEKIFWLLHLDDLVCLYLGLILLTAGFPAWFGLASMAWHRFCWACNSGSRSLAWYWFCWAWLSWHWEAIGKWWVILCTNYCLLRPGKNIAFFSIGNSGD